MRLTDRKPGNVPRGTLTDLACLGREFTTYFERPIESGYFGLPWFVPFNDASNVMRREMAKHEPRSHYHRHGRDGMNVATGSKLPKLWVEINSDMLLWTGCTGVGPLLPPQLPALHHDPHHRRLSRRIFCVLALCFEDLLRGAASLETVGVTNPLLLPG